ncbi:hypothetical protein [Streptomyces sp. NPDC046261]|uniref:hypothetical protein n=1 Tax=Streptomyces sp. NPDC046261 TaxID=3157200 RepID=UPI0033EA4A43
MPEHKYAATAQRNGCTEVPSLPDLTGVGLRALRTDRTPDLSAAVERALSFPAEFGETWYSDSTEAGLWRATTEATDRPAPGPGRPPRRRAAPPPPRGGADAGL